MAIGLLGTFLLTRTISAFLFGITATDATTVAAATLLLVVAAAVAAYLPARRASRVNPLIALRHE